MKKAVLFLLAFAGLPFVWACVRALFNSLAAGLTEDSFFAPGCVAFLAGAAAMVALYFWKGRELSIVYVFGHEMTHALVGLCFFARIHSVNIRETGGFVELSKSNLFITLAPYCVPFYLFIVIGVHALATCIAPQPVWPWYAAFGVTTAFHILYTLDALLTVAQPDVRAYGRFFSYWFILVVNLLFALLALVAIGHISFRGQAHALRVQTVDAYVSVVDLARRLIP